MTLLIACGHPEGRPVSASQAVRAHSTARDVGSPRSSSEVHSPDAPVYAGDCLLVPGDDVPAPVGWDGPTADGRCGPTMPGVTAVSVGNDATGFVRTSDVLGPF